MCHGRSQHQQCEAVQALGGGTRDFPGEGGADQGTRDFPAQGNEGTRDFGSQGYNQGSQSRGSTSSMACFMMVVKAIIKMKSKQNVRS